LEAREDRPANLSVASEPTKAQRDNTLIRALAPAHRWKRLLEEGRYRSAAEIAEAEGVTRSFVKRLLRLTLLAPDIVEAILDGRQPKGLQLENLTRVLPQPMGGAETTPSRAIDGSSGHPPRNCGSILSMRRTA
jgi:hypothetical protein